MGSRGPCLTEEQLQDQVTLPMNDCSTSLPHSWPNDVVRHWLQHEDRSPILISLAWLRMREAPTDLQTQGTDVSRRHLARFLARGCGKP